MSENLVLLILLPVLFGVAVFLAAAEVSLIRVRPSAVEVEAGQGDRRARRLLRLLTELPLVMNTVLLTVLLVQIGAATVTGLLASQVFGNLGVTLASVGLTVLMFVYGESIPKTFAVQNPLPVAKSVALPVATLTWLLRPVVRLLIAFADLQAPGKGIAGMTRVSEEELRYLAAEAESLGEISASDLDLVERAFRLGDLTVEQILVPRTDVVAVPLDAPAVEVLDTAIAGGFRRVPVYEGSLDNITGVVLLRDLARVARQGLDARARQLARPVLVVPESGRVIELLRRMQEAGTHFAVAIDEHGGTAGIVTIEDAVEELLGAVADEGERRELLIQQLGSERWRVDATTSVDELADRLQATLPEGDWTTVGGLVIGLAGHIPDPGVEVKASGYTFKVLSASRRRVRQVEVWRTGGHAG